MTLFHLMSLGVHDWNLLDLKISVTMVLHHQEQTSIQSSLKSNEVQVKNLSMLTSLMKLDWLLTNYFYPFFFNYQWIQTQVFKLQIYYYGPRI